MKELLFLSYAFGDAEKKQLYQDGHFLLPQILTPSAQQQLIASLSRNLEIPATAEHLPTPVNADNASFQKAIRLVAGYLAEHLSLNPINAIMAASDGNRPLS